MKPLLLLLFVGCGSITHGRVVTVPIVARCGESQFSHGQAIVVPPSSVVTVSHVVRCDNGMPADVILADGHVVVVDFWDDDAVRLTAKTGSPWTKLPSPVLGSVHKGQSGGPVFDSDGEVIGVLNSQSDVYLLVTKVRKLVEGAPQIPLDVGTEWP